MRLQWRALALWILQDSLNWFVLFFCWTKQKSQFPLCTHRKKKQMSKACFKSRLWIPYLGRALAYFQKGPKVSSLVWQTAKSLDEAKGFISRVWNLLTQHRENMHFGDTFPVFFLPTLKMKATVSCKMTKITSKLKSQCSIIDNLQHHLWQLTPQ